MSRDGDFLSRWSRRKHAARKGEVEEAPPKSPVTAAPQAATAAAAEAPQAMPELPPVESLTIESDFSPFMHKDVEPGLRRQALKTLFRDPRFNVMDGLDVYIDDYSKPDPIPPDWLGKLNQMARLGDYQPPEAKSEPEDPPGVAAEGGPLVVENQGIDEVAPAPEAEVPADRSPPQESKHS